MGTPTNHPKTINLDCCWICSAKFIEDGGTEPREDHHVIPVAYGGVDGPTVTLCDSHHTKVHRSAVAMKASKDPMPTLNGEPHAHVQKLLLLATHVYNAEKATRNDPNKAATVTIQLKATHKAMVDKLKNVYPADRSREAVLLRALEGLYRKHFIT